MATNKISDKLVSDLGKAIRTRRLAIKLSQEALSEVADFDRTYISLLERGERNPSFTNLCRIAQALGVTPSELLEGLTYESKLLIKRKAVSLDKTPLNKTTERRTDV